MTKTSYQSENGIMTKKILFFLSRKLDLKNLKNFINVSIITKHRVEIYNSTRCFVVYPKTTPIKNGVFGLYPFGDPYGNRTHDSALRGLRLSRLTNGPCQIRLILYHTVFKKASSFYNKF